MCIDFKIAPDEDYELHLMKTMVTCCEHHT